MPILTLDIVNLTLWIDDALPHIIHVPWKICHARRFSLNDVTAHKRTDSDLHAGKARLHSWIAPRVGGDKAKL